MRVGLFGGTFDPPHTGHLVVAQDAALALALDRIVFVPAAVPPHKLDRAISAPPLRVRMLELALAGNAAFALDALELERPGPSYTVDTLRELQRRDPAERVLLLGADQYAEFDTWRAPDEVLRLATIAVLQRGGHASAGGAAPTAVELRRGVVRVNVTRIDISSTLIRERVAARRPIRYLVPAAVHAFIEEEGLYVRTGAPATG